MNFNPIIQSPANAIVEMYKVTDPEDALEVNKVCALIRDNLEVWAQQDWNGKSILKISKKNLSSRYSIYLAKGQKKDEPLHVFINLGKKHFIDKGGHKIVYHAVNYDHLQQWVLAKTNLDSVLRKEMSQNEATFLVNFPGSEEILQTDLFEVLPTKTNDKQYIFMPFLELGSLENAFKNPLSLNEKDKKEVAFDIVKALLILHSNDVAFRDIKPGNILLYRKEGKIRAKLSDFGLSFSLKEKEFVKIETSPYLYTPEMLEIKAMSGSQINVNLLLPSDIWALGLTFYQLFLGTQAFKQEYEAYRAQRKLDPENGAAQAANYKTQVLDYLKIHLPEPEDKNGLKYLIWQMLNIDHSKRPTTPEINQRLITLFQ